MDLVQPLHYTAAMPTVARLSSCTITLFAADHLPPHFHVRMTNGREALVEISTLSILRGSMRPRERIETMTWAVANLSLLSAKWKELNP